MSPIYRTHSSPAINCNAQDGSNCQVSVDHVVLFITYASDVDNQPHQPVVIAVQQHTDIHSDVKKQVHGTILILWH